MSPVILTLGQPLAANEKPSIVVIGSDGIGESDNSASSMVASPNNDSYHSK
jgi:hypothetical protein